jgi:hypothetical protein
MRILQLLYDTLHSVQVASADGPLELRALLCLSDLDQETFPS